MQKQIMPDGTDQAPDRRLHWEHVYQTRQAAELSWFEAEPAASLSLIQSISPEGGRIIDVGGGASLLVNRLLAAGHWDVTVLDISPAALALARAHLGTEAIRVRWIEADITKVQELGSYDVWHDRAVFHFLISSEDRAAYLAQLDSSLLPGGHVILGTFALHGPYRCSGLPVCRYSAQTLAATLGSNYSLVRALEYSHRTPGGTTQPFTFGLFRKVALRGRAKRSIP